MTPRGVLSLRDARLRRIGFSRQKAAYGRGLARAIVGGALDLRGVADLDDEAARAELMRFDGVGPWTADCYLLMALRRADIWPPGDVALLQSLRRVKRRPSVPTREQASALVERWRPYRAVAARLLWHHCGGGGVRPVLSRGRTRDPSPG